MTLLRLVTGQIKYHHHVQVKFDNVYDWSKLYQIKYNRQWSKNFQPIHSKTENIFGCANDKLALLSTHGLYVVAEEDGNANANREQKSSWETFTIDDLGDNKFSFRSVHDKYLVAENLFHGYEVNCNRDRASTWEKFNAEVQKDGTVAFKTAHKHYLVAERDGRLRANRLWVGSFEKFTTECRGTVQSFL